MTSHENQEYDNFATCRGPGFIWRCFTKKATGSWKFSLRNIIRWWAPTSVYRAESIVWVLARAENCPNESKALVLK